MDIVKDFYSTDYEIRGKHGQMVKKLTGTLDEEKIQKIKIFDTNINVMVNAPMIGFIFKEKAEEDKSNALVAKIAGAQMMAYSEDLKYVMQLILLLDSSYEPDFLKRVDKAFRHFGECEEDLELFEAYMRGGIEVLYDKIIGDASTPFDIADNLVTFMYEFHDNYNESVSEGEIIKLCNEFAGKQK